MSRAQVAETTVTPTCRLTGQICRHFHHAYRFVRKEFSVLKTHTTESAVFREDLGPFCNAEGLFIVSMLHGCPNVTGYDYLATGAAEHDRTRTGKTRAPPKPPVPCACKVSSERYTPVRDSQQTKLRRCAEVANDTTDSSEDMPANLGAMATVRFLQDCDQFTGADGETYLTGEGNAFKTGDIVTIPALNAAALIERGVADDVSPPKSAPAGVALPVGVTIPQRLKNSEYRFLLVDRQSKKPTETDWPKYAFDDSRLLIHISRGGNYGVVPGAGGLCVLDADDLQRLEELGILGLFAETFTVSNDGGA